MITPSEYYRGMFSTQHGAGVWGSTSIVADGSDTVYGLCDPSHQALKLTLPGEHS